tara:strand:- start:159 stop:374 length:216 start_codon:yes stop_codon:yes gene_type:complete
MITDNSLYWRIIKIHPSLTQDPDDPTDNDFHPILGTIELVNDSDGKGDYIKRWDHPTLTEPTEAEIKAVTL